MARARDPPIEGLTPDATLLVMGPPMTGKYELMLQLLAAQADSVVLITTKNDADRVVEDYRSIAGDVPEDRIGVVDCVSRHDAADDSGTIRHVDAPSNMTAIGVEFTDLFGEFYDDPDAGHVGVGLHSISQLLMHASLKQVYQFLQVLAGQIRSAEGFGVAVMDTSTVDDEGQQLLQHHFDGVVETRENDAGEREFRVRGLAPKASDWTGF